jgi:hypothetical protein
MKGQFGFERFANSRGESLVESITRKSAEVDLESLESQHDVGWDAKASRSDSTSSSSTCRPIT